MRTTDPDSGINHHLPLLVFDGDCGFCRIWVHYWRRLTGDRVSYAPYQEVSQQFPQVSPAQFQYAVQLFLPDGRVLSGATLYFEPSPALRDKGGYCGSTRIFGGSR